MQKWLIIFVVIICAAAFAFFPACLNASPVTVFAPSVPTIEKISRQPAKKGEKKHHAWKDDNIPEVDILMSLMNPHEYQGVDMDMPRLFTMIWYPAAAPGEELKPESKNLLGDVEEIRYLDKRAWGANVALPQPGLYQFIFDGRPVWDAAHDRYFQHQARLMLPVSGVENGWEMAGAQDFEIQPLTRPFGLVAPALFSGRVLVNGKEASGLRVFMGRMNVSKQSVPTEWHKKMEAITDASGQFSFVLNKPGWWYCEAVMPGTTLKGPDGQQKNVLKSAIFWLYVDNAQDDKGKK